MKQLQATSSELHVFLWVLIIAHPNFSERYFLLKVSLSFSQRTKIKEKLQRRQIRGLVQAGCI